MKRFMILLAGALIVVVMSALSAAPAFAQDNNNAGANNAVCFFPDTNTTSLIDADVCVATGGVIVDVL